MLNIKCPYCGDRSQKEFAYGGDGTVVRPQLNQEVTDEEDSTDEVISDEDIDDFVDNLEDDAEK